MVFFAHKNYELRAACGPVAEQTACSLRSIMLLNYSNPKTFFGLMLLPLVIPIVANKNITENDIQFNFISWVSQKKTSP